MKHEIYGLIPYKTDKDQCETPCPYGRNCMVGSYVCHACMWCKGDDTISQILQCKNPLNYAD